jgi:mannose-1-phosphate guanylyltransferase
VKALLLAAGFGTRLRPITEDIPKCLVPIAGKPLIQYWLDHLLFIGVKQILINTHYLSSMVEDYLKNSKYSKYVELIYEDDLLGTAGTFFKNLDFFGEDDGILIHADTIIDGDLSDLVNCYKNRSDNIVLTMLSFRTLTPESCGIIHLDKNDIVVKYFEKPMKSDSNLANGAVFIFSKQFINNAILLKDGGDDFCRDIIPRFVGKMNAYETKNFFIDIGTKETYAKANTYFNSKKINGDIVE